MQIQEWLTQRQISHVAVVRHGDEADLMDLMRGDGTQPLLIVCQRGTAERLAFEAVVDGRPRPTLIVSKGLVRDVQTVAEHEPPKPALICAGVVRAHLDSECHRTRAQTHLLSGYELAADTLDAVVAARLVACLRSMAERLSLPLVLHDGDGHVPKSILAAISVFEYPAVDTRAVADVMAEIRPSAELVTEHARFLTATEPALLISMHAQLSGHACRPVFEIWDRQLAQLLERGGDAGLVVAARNRLRDLQTALGAAAR